MFLCNPTDVRTNGEAHVLAHVGGGKMESEDWIQRRSRQSGEKEIANLLTLWCTKRPAGQGFEISRYSATKGEKPDPICLSAILGKIDEKSGNPPQAFQLNAVEQNTFLPTSL